MGLRSRLKNRIKRLVGAEPPPAPPAPAPQATRKPPVAPPAPPPPAPAPQQTEEERKAAEKAAAHLEKTKRAVLRFVDEAGGECGLGEMHDYSERRWFVAHKKFSDLMETFVAEALLDYNHAEGRATLTEAGRQYLVDNPPPKRR